MCYFHHTTFDFCGHERLEIAACQFESDTYCPEEQQTVYYRHFDGWCEACELELYRLEEEQRQQQALNDLLVLQAQYEREKAEFDREYSQEMQGFEEALSQFISSDFGPSLEVLDFDGMEFDGMEFDDNQQATPETVTASLSELTIRELMVRTFCKNKNPVLCTGTDLHLEREERYHHCAECEEFDNRKYLSYRGLAEGDPDNDPYFYVQRGNKKD
ncbi:hypothetical protein F5884DRAFT_757189 [Xylogone sp. PMI_703]|nr:hypothetical protein F5884DRAFT_757189 [Xylogone sp. PMI_703]